MKKGSKRPYYGTGTKREVTMQYELGRTSASELAELHGILGSNTISNWQKKFGNSPAQKPPGMEKEEDVPAGEVREKRRRRQRRYEQERISELEQELELARLRVRLYACAIEVASEEMGVDLLKKIGGRLLAERTKQG
jgi:transposase-like protein